MSGLRASVMKNLLLLALLSRPALGACTWDPRDCIPRASVVELLCSPRTKEIVKSKDIQLVSYNDLWDEVYGKTTSK